MGLKIENFTDDYSTSPSGGTCQDFFHFHVQMARSQVSARKGAKQHRR
jgi:hypothetical protein